MFSGNQNAAFAQLFAGRARAVGSNSMLVDGYAERERKGFRVLWSSEGYHDLALMASSKVPEKDVQAVGRAFFGMDKDPKGREILHSASKEVGLTADANFIASDGSEYDTYRRFYRSAPANLR